MSVHTSFMLYATVAVLVGLLMMLQAVTPSMKVRRKLQVEEESGAVFDLPDNTACYESLNGIETHTSLDWWNVKPSQKFTEPTSFFKNRLQYEPLKDSTTMIAGVLFSFSNHTLKMSVLFPPLYPEESRVAKLLLTNRNTGELVATRECDIIPNIWKCGIRVDSSDLLVDKEQDYSYEVQYQPSNNEATISYTYNGVIPVPRENPRIIGLGCFGFDDKTEKESLVAAVKNVTPDLIVLQGDQTYFHNDLGFGFLQLVYSISEITRSVPTIVQMDDHDYGEGNLWGAGDSTEEDSGAGFSKPVCLINAIQELGMGHNPDSATKGTLVNGIDIYYTNYIYGQVDFAVLEARKFKNRINGDSLLGDEQEEWLQGWCDNDRDKRLKVVLTQTPFATLGTHATGNSGGGVYEVAALPDDPNGFPAEGRRRAMEILNGCTNLILSGDQHVAIGVTYDDYGITECASPAAINSIFWRLNKNTVGGRHIDPNGHEYTLNAVWNVQNSMTVAYKLPRQTITANDEMKHARGDGFLVVDISNNNMATCSAHSYRTGILQSPVWNFTVPVSLPS